MDRSALPVGTVTFLFTDIEGSTRLLHELGEAAYADALAEHRRRLRDAFARHGGAEVDTQGDAFFIAFPSAAEALAAATEGQAALGAGPIRVRMGVHTGTPLRTDEGYVGMDVHRAARIAAAGHGGQVIVSATTAEAVTGVDLLDLGEHRLKDLAAPERIYQLGDETFPPLKALSVSNLPVPAGPFVGRDEELGRLTALIQDPAVRIVTVTGPGGIGKTRLALQAAAESTASFPDGLWWVALARLTDPALVAPTIGETLGVRPPEGVPMREALAERLEGRRTLLLLDNAEHLLPGLVAELGPILSTDGPTILVTSRERLGLTDEHVFTVPTLAQDDAVDFFRTRASMLGIAVEPSGLLLTLCDRLDRLPLALQLAAARLRVLSLEQIHDRLSQRLDLLKGARDADPRQATIRATIAWSHELLSEEEQTAFRRLAVFVGGATLAAVEEVGRTDADTLLALLDKSLVQRREDAPEPRFWMLESIGDFARERLDDAGERADLRARHAAFFRELARAMGDRLRAGEPEEGPVALLHVDIDNLRAAVAFGLETGDAALVREITSELPMYWVVRGQYAEGRGWLDRALALAPDEDPTRRRLLSGLAMIAYAQGDHTIAVPVADEAAALAMRLAGADERYAGIRERAFAAYAKGELETAEGLWVEAFEAAAEADNGVGMSASRINGAATSNKGNRFERAYGLLSENLPFVRSRGQTRCEATTLAALAETTVYLGRPQDGEADALEGARRARQIDDDPLTVYALDVAAVGAADRGDHEVAATILGATEAAREAMGNEPDEDEQRIRDAAIERFNRAAFEEAWARGKELDLDAAVELATSARGMTTTAEMGRS